jgi:mediator of RNA polymerase II transcription subunit 4
MRSMLERPISQLQTLSQALFSALSTGHLAEPPIAALAACDAELAEATRLTRIHLLKQKRIEQLMDEVYELDAQLIEVVETLATGQRELQAVIEEGEERISSADKARKGEHSYTTRRLCLTCLPRSRGFLPATNRIRVKASRFHLRSSECSDG